MNCGRGRAGATVETDRTPDAIPVLMAPPPGAVTSRQSPRGTETTGLPSDLHAIRQTCSGGRAGWGSRCHGWPWTDPDPSAVLPDRDVHGGPIPRWWMPSGALRHAERSALGVLGSDRSGCSAGPRDRGRLAGRQAWPVRRGVIGDHHAPVCAPWAAEGTTLDGTSRRAYASQMGADPHATAT